MAMAAISSSIMEVIGGNPFSTLVGQKVEQATDPSLASENWGMFMEICDLVNCSEDGPRDAIRAIRKRLQGFVGRNYSSVIYALTLLETCVKNCGHRFHVLACSKDSVQDLVKIIGPKYEPPQVVQEKVLGLIQSWAEAFRTQPDLQGVVQVYSDLKLKGVQFPPTDLDSMAPIQTPPRSVEPQPKPSQQQPHVVPHAPSAAPVAFKLTEEQLGKLKSELDIVESNTRVMKEMLADLMPGEEHPEDAELLQDLHETCRAMQQRVVALISQVSNDDLIADLLRINDDLNAVFLGYGKYKRARASKEKPKEDALIEFGDEGNKLAGDLKAMNVSGAPAEVDSEFDMFAQSRSASSKNQGATYEDNINIETAPRSLGETAQTRLLPKSDPGHQEGMTSSEFDQFLAERASAAERGATSPARRPKPSEEDAMFGL